MSVCLRDHDLEAFVGQGASEQELSAWSAHLESCDTGAARLARNEHALRSAASKGESDQQPKADPALAWFPGRDSAAAVAGTHFFQRQRTILCKRGESPGQQ